MTGRFRAVLQENSTSAKLSNAATGPDQGDVDIYIDGKFVKTVDTSSKVRRTQQKVFSVAGLRKGKHTFQAVKRSGDILRSDVIRYTE